MLISTKSLTMHGRIKSMSKNYRKETSKTGSGDLFDNAQ